MTNQEFLINSMVADKFVQYAAVLANYQSTALLEN